MDPFTEPCLCKPVVLNRILTLATGLALSDEVNGVLPARAEPLGQVKDVDRVREVVLGAGAHLSVSLLGILHQPVNHRHSHRLAGTGHPTDQGE